MSTATLTPDRAAILEYTRPGREAAYANKLAKTTARMEEAEFFLSCGMSVEEAAVRAGWPSVCAACRAAYRNGNPELARQFNRSEKTRRRAVRKALAR